MVRPLSRSKQSLENDTELGHQRDLLALGHESVALKKLLSLPERRRLGGTAVLLRDEDQRALLGGEWFFVAQLVRAWWEQHQGVGWFPTMVTLY